MVRGNITTADSIVGRRISSQLGIVRGIGVESLLFLISEGVFVGPDVERFTERLEFAYATAEFNMATNAEKLGGNGVIAVKYVVAQNARDTIEVVAYGTAVVVED